MDAETAVLLEVTRRHTRALSKQLRTVARLHAQLADLLDEEAADSTAQPHEAAQRQEAPNERDD